MQATCILVICGKILNFIFLSDSSRGVFLRDKTIIRIHIVSCFAKRKYVLFFKNQVFYECVLFIKVLDLENNLNILLIFFAWLSPIFVEINHIILPASRCDPHFIQHRILIQWTRLCYDILRPLNWSVNISVTVWTFFS